MSIDINPESVARALKEEGNNFFKNNEYQNACDKYTQAIDILPSAILYANRSFCYLKMECCGEAIRDASKAIDLDPKYEKGYYRRACAHFYTGDIEAALKDFISCQKINDKDLGVARKVKQVRSLVHSERFSEAVHVEVKSCLDTIVFRDIRYSTPIEGPSIDYVNDGSKVEDYTITERFILDMQKWHKEGHKIHIKFVYVILIKTILYLKTLPNILDVSLPEGKNDTFRVCGDVHGQYYDFINIFNKYGYPSASAPYLFNGDFTDRGNFSVEIALTVFCYKLVKPDSFYVLRGNHESPVCTVIGFNQQINKMFGFDGEARQKYNDTVMNLFSECFRALPLSAILEKKVLILHGGLFEEDGVTLNDIQKIDRFSDCMSGLLEHILWSDPMNGNGRQPSRREAGTMFGADVTKRFLQENNLDLLVRSHEVKMDGYDVQHDFEAVPHPGPGPMHYAPQMY